MEGEESATVPIREVAEGMALDDLQRLAFNVLIHLSEPPVSGADLVADLSEVLSDAGFDFDDPEPGIYDRHGRNILLA